MTRKLLAGILTAGATLSVGILAFAGTLLFTTSLPWCIAAFVLAAAYEVQINGEGISATLKRLFDSDYTAYQVMVYEAENDENFFLKDEYEECKAYIKDLHKHSEHLKKSLHIFTDENPDEIRKKIQANKQARKAAKKFLRELLLNPLREGDNRLNVAALKNEISRRKKWEKFGWLVSIAAGVSAGFSTLGSLSGSITSAAATVPLLGALSPLALTIMAAVAGAGYTFLICQTWSDMLHDTRGTWSKMFKRQFQNGVRETVPHYAVRTSATVFAVLLAAFTTLATAGTWWFAIKEGGAVLNLSQRIISLIRWTTVIPMTLPTFVFNGQNSIETINRISRPHHHSHDDRSPGNPSKISWNPFLLAEKAIDTIQQPFVFLLHIISIGLMSDRLGNIPPWILTFFGAAGEGLTDWNYQPEQHNHAGDGNHGDHSPHHDHPDGHHHDHGKKPKHRKNSDDHAHHHESIFLTALFMPFIIVRGTLKSCGALSNWGAYNLLYQISRGTHGHTVSLWDSFKTVFTPHLHPDSKIIKPALLIEQEAREKYRTLIHQLKDSSPYVEKNGQIILPQAEAPALLGLNCFQRLFHCAQARIQPAPAPRVPSQGL